MRDELFAFYIDFRHRFEYYRAYLNSARRISNLYSGFLLLTSAGGIVTLSIWTKYPIIWAIITFVAQVLQALQPLTQAPKQQQALRYILQDMETMVDELQSYWNAVCMSDPPTKSDSAISYKINEYKRRFHNSFCRFASDIDFPFKKRIEKIAKEANERFFWYYYKIRSEEEF